MSHMKTPLSVEAIDADGDYGSGEDVHSGYKAYAITDADGRVLFDSLNRDSANTEIKVESDGESFLAWDHLAKSDAERIVRAVNAHDELVTAAQEAIRLIDWLKLIAKPDVEMHKHEIRGQAEMFQARIATALAKSEAA